MKPILKYRGGGKSDEIPRLSQYFPKQYDRYIEPFFGGGAVFWHLEPQTAILSDINPGLMGFYTEMASRPAALMAEIEALSTIYERNQQEYLAQKQAAGTDVRIPNKNETLYRRVRDTFNQTIRPCSMAAAYFFLNKTSYCGMTRFNQKGQYNVPFGRYPHLTTKGIDQAHSDLLQRAEIHMTDFENVFKLSRPGDFMFLDLPYDCTFNDYGNGQRWTEDDHIRLAKAFERLPCKVLMVINETPLTRSLYAKYVAETYGKAYSVNIRNRFKAAATHMIVTKNL